MDNSYAERQLFGYIYINTMLLTLPSVKHGGGSVVVLGATFEPVVKIKIYGFMNTGKYNQITDPPCNAMWSHLISNSFVFLHNNNLKHKATAVKAYLEKHTTVMDFFPRAHTSTFLKRCGIILT